MLTQTDTYTEPIARFLWMPQAETAKDEDTSPTLIKLSTTYKGFYDPEIARFIQEDPFRGNPRNALSLNRYTYAHNSPMVYYDPTGYSASKITAPPANAGTPNVPSVWISGYGWMSTKNVTNMPAGTPVTVPGISGTLPSTGSSATGSNNTSSSGRSSTTGGSSSSGNTLNNSGSIGTATMGNNSTVNNSGNIANLIMGNSAAVNNSGIIGNLTIGRNATINNTGTIGKILSLPTRSGSTGNKAGNGGGITVYNSATLDYINFTNGGVVASRSGGNSGSIFAYSNDGRLLHSAAINNANSPSILAISSNAAHAMMLARNELHSLTGSGKGTAEIVSGNALHITASNPFNAIAVGTETYNFMKAFGIGTYGIMHLIEMMSTQLSGKTIFIDPGHGDVAGASGYLNGVLYREEVLALDISLHLRRYLEALGAAVHMSHDVLSNAVNFRYRNVNYGSPDMFISIHLNAALNTSANGIEILYKHNSPDSRDIASHVLDSILENTSLASRSNPLVPRNNLDVLNRSMAPAILVEAGFMSNQNDLRYVVNNTNDIAAAIALGILGYYRR